MSKRIFLAIAALTMSCGAAFSKPVSVARAENEEVIESVDESVYESAESVEESVDEPAEEIYECKVTECGYWIDENGNKTEDTAKKYGDVYITALEGHVGDVSTIVVATNIHFEYSDDELKTFRYCVDSVSVNDVELTAIETNKYEFTLVEGINRVEVVYKGMATIAVTDLKSLNWKSLLTVENLVSFATWAVALFLSTGFFVTWLKSKKIKQSTTKQVQEATAKTIEDSIVKLLPEALSTIIFPVIDKMAKKEDANGNAIASLLKCMLASLSDDPKMKIAIADELMKLQYNDQDLNNQVKGIIKEYMESEEAKKTAKKEAIEDLKEINDSIGSDGYGDL